MANLNSDVHQLKMLFQVQAFKSGLALFTRCQEQKLNLTTTTPLEFFSSCTWDWAQQYYGGVVDDVECLLGLHSSTVL